jgi:hypothetical protein
MSKSHTTKDAKHASEFAKKLESHEKELFAKRQMQSKVL